MSPAAWRIGYWRRHSASHRRRGRKRSTTPGRSPTAQDNGLAAVRSQAEAAELDAAAARAQRWPTLAVGGAYTRLDDSPAFDFGFTGLPITPPGALRRRRFRDGPATLTVPLFTSGRISSSIAAAEARGRGAGAQAHGAEADVKLAVAEAYVGVLRAPQGARGRARATCATLESMASDVERDVRARAGAEERPARGAGGTRRRAAGPAAGRECRRDRAAPSYNRGWASRLDRPVDLDREPARAGGAAGVIPTSCFAKRCERAHGAHVARRAGCRIRPARAGRSAARALPQLSLTGAYNYLENTFLDDEDFASAGIGVQWAVFDGGQTPQARRGTRPVTARHGAAARGRAITDCAAGAAGVARRCGNARAPPCGGGRRGAGRGEPADRARALRCRASARRRSCSRRRACVCRRCDNRDDAALDAGLARLRLARAVGDL